MDTLRKYGLEVLRSAEFGEGFTFIQRRISDEGRVFATFASTVTFTLEREGEVVAKGTAVIDTVEGRFAITHYEVIDCERNVDLLTPAIPRELARRAAEVYLVETNLTGDDIEIPDDLVQRSIGRASNLSSATASAVQRKGRPRLSDETLTEVFEVYTAAEDRARLTAVRKHFGITQSKAQNWVAASRKRLPQLWEGSR